MSLIPVILCGGAGSRLWPLSREMHPKPFIRMDDGQSLLQKAFLRGTNLPDVTQVFTVANQEHVFKIAAEYEPVNIRRLPTVSLLEPFGRNTAAAVAAAALYAADSHPDATLLILPADQIIANEAAFAQAIVTARALATDGELVTFGISPGAPETGYGYIEAEGNRVLRFVEKPDAATAQGYFDSRRYYWNSGMFCFTVQAIVQEMRKHCPAILDAVRACLDCSRTAVGTAGVVRCELDAPTFAIVPADSIDYAVMEKTDRAAVVPCDIGWSDVGSWTTLGDLTAADNDGNRIEGDVYLHDVARCTIRGSDRVVGVVGVSDLVIIDTPDALLITTKNQAQDVRHIFKRLQDIGHTASQIHNTVHRPWGSYTVLEEGAGYKIKRIEVNPGASLSLQMHHHRSEHWVIVSGVAQVVNGEEERLVAPNESTFIPAGHKHRVSNPGVVDLVMIEVQSGEYLGEDDIVRFEDKYNRV